jgi:hypothetical protein
VLSPHGDIISNNVMEQRGAVRKARCNVYPATPRNQPTPRNHLQTSSKPQDLTTQFSFKMTDLTGFILEEIAGSSSSETSNIVQVVAVTAAWQKDMMETLLRYHQLQAKLLAAAISIGAIRNQSVPRRIAYTLGHFDLFAQDDEWCVEFLRFTRRQIVEMAMLLDIPSQFGDGYEANPTTALSLVLFRPSESTRPEPRPFHFAGRGPWPSPPFAFSPASTGSF